MLGGSYLNREATLATLRAHGAPRKVLHELGLAAAFAPMQVPVRPAQSADIYDTS